MFEFGFRLAAALGVLMVSWILRVPNLDFAWKWSLAVAGYAVFAAILDRRHLKSGQVADILAIADSVAISLVLASADILGQVAFLSLVPIAFAVVMRGAQTSIATPIAVGAVIAAQILLGTGELSTAFLAQCGGILMIGMILRPQAAAHFPPDDLQPPQPTLAGDDIDFRERFRSLRAYARELEQRVGRDKWVTTLFEAKRATEGRLTERLSRVLRDQSGAEGISIHVVSDSRIVFAAASGKLDSAVRRAAFDLRPGQGDLEIQERFKIAMRALAPAELRTASRCILLRSESKLTGMVTVHHAREENLDAAVRRVELAAPIVAVLIDDELDRVRTRRRLKEIEVLYDISSLVAGAEKPENVLKRAVRELAAEWEIDHIGAFRLRDDRLDPIEEHGAELRLLETMSFAAGPGVAGWKGLGMPELFLPAAGDDQRVPEREAIKRRIGSFLALPVAERFVITAATHHTFGISSSMVETMRLIGAELDSAVARLEGYGGASGLTHPTEFFGAIGSLGAGWLCYLEPVHREDILESFGKAAFDRALRQLAARLRTVLPPGALLTRREEGDFVAFLPEADESAAQSYLSEASATAAMVPLRTPDGKHKIPLALRGRIAPIAKSERIAS